MIIIYLFTFLIGLALGSFFNVLIYRIPRKESIAFPPSHCPLCNEHISFYDNIPVLSYIILRGRCRHCNARISPVYPFVELITGIVFLLIVIAYGLTIAAPVLMLCFSFLIVLSGIDMLYREINVYALIWPYVIAGVFIFLNTHMLPENLISPGVPDFRDAIIGSAAGALMFFLVRFIGSRIMKREAMGEADIYIAALTGLILGLQLFFFSLIFAGILGIIFYAMFSRIKSEPEIPFIPFLSAGAFAALILGPFISGMMM